MKFRFATPLLCRIGTCAFLLLLCVFVSAGTRAASDPPIPSGSIRIHYHRPDGNYSGWTVYAFDNTTENTGNYGGGPVQVTGTDSFGAYFDVGVTTGRARSWHHYSQSNSIRRRVFQKDTPNNLFVDPAAQGIEFWAYSGIAKLYTRPRPV